jgi:hypothetical protein
MTTDVTGFIARGCAADRVPLPGGFVPPPNARSGDELDSTRRLITATGGIAAAAADVNLVTRLAAAQADMLKPCLPGQILITGVISRWHTTSVTAFTPRPARQGSWLCWHRYWGEAGWSWS